MENPYAAPKSRIVDPDENRPPMPSEIRWLAVSFGLLLASELVLASTDGRFEHWQVLVVTNAVCVGALVALLFGSDWGWHGVLWICVFALLFIVYDVVFGTEVLHIIRWLSGAIAIVCVVLLANPRARSFCRR